jgi:uncharacterized YigZ family protein
MITLASPAEHEQDIKHSRFLARACRVDSPEQALAFLQQVKDPEATHNCWAWKVGEAYRFSDDGEPGGTAGRPILSAIEGQQLDHVVVVVTRWFGGIKLGAGGLVRAYAGVAAECLRLAARKEVRPAVQLRIEVGFEDTGALYPIVERLGVRKLSEQYVAEGLTMQVELDADQEQVLRDLLRDATRGRARVSTTEPRA